MHGLPPPDKQCSHLLTTSVPVCLQVRDFGLVFDALTHFEESLLAAKMAAAGDEAEEVPAPEVRPRQQVHM